MLSWIHVRNVKREPVAVHRHPTVLWDGDRCPTAGQDHPWEESHTVIAQSDTHPLECVCAVPLFVQLSCQSWAAVMRGGLLNVLLLCETELHWQGVGLPQ